MLMQYPFEENNSLYDGRFHNISPISLCSIRLLGRQFFIMRYNDLTARQSDLFTLIEETPNGWKKIPLDDYNVLFNYINENQFSLTWKLPSEIKMPRSISLGEKINLQFLLNSQKLNQAGNIIMPSSQLPPSPPPPPGDKNPKLNQAGNPSSQLPPSPPPPPGDKNPNSRQGIEKYMYRSSLSEPDNPMSIGQITYYVPIPADPEVIPNNSSRIFSFSGEYINVLPGNSTYVFRKEIPFEFLDKNKYTSNPTLSNYYSGDVFYKAIAEIISEGATSFEVTIKKSNSTTLAIFQIDDSTQKSSRLQPKERAIYLPTGWNKLKPGKYHYNVFYIPFVLKGDYALSETCSTIQIDAPYPEYNKSDKLKAFFDAGRKALPMKFTDSDGKVYENEAFDYHI